MRRASLEGQTLFSAGLKSKQKQLDQLRENRKNMEFNQLYYQVTRRAQENRNKADEKMKKIFTQINPSELSMKQTQLITKTDREKHRILRLNKNEAEPVKKATKNAVPLDTYG